MSLAAFLDSATTMLFEEFQRVGLDAFAAFDRVREWAAGTAVGLGLVADAPVEKPAARVPSAAENQRSMQEFMSRLAGVGGMPG